MQTLIESSYFIFLYAFYVILFSRSNGGKLPWLFFSIFLSFLNLHGYQVTYWCLITNFIGKWRRLPLSSNPWVEILLTKLKYDKKIRRGTWGQEYTWQIPWFTFVEINFRDDLQFNLTAINLSFEVVSNEFLVRGVEAETRRQWNRSHDHLLELLLVLRFENERGWPASYSKTRRPALEINHRTITLYERKTL